MVITLTANYANLTFMALLYGGGLGGKQFCINVGATDNDEGFFNMGGASYNL